MPGWGLDLLRTPVRRNPRRIDRARTRWLSGSRAALCVGDLRLAQVVTDPVPDLCGRLRGRWVTTPAGHSMACHLGGQQRPRRLVARQPFGNRLVMRAQPAIDLTAAAVAFESFRRKHRPAHARRAGQPQGARCERRRLLTRSRESLVLRGAPCRRRRHSVLAPSRLRGGAVAVVLWTNAPKVRSADVPAVSVITHTALPTLSPFAGATRTLIARNRDRKGRPTMTASNGQAGNRGSGSGSAATSREAGTDPVSPQQFQPTSESLGATASSPSPSLVEFQFEGQVMRTVIKI